MPQEIQTQGCRSGKARETLARKARGQPCGISSNCTYHLSFFQKGAQTAGLEDWCPRVSRWAREDEMQNSAHSQQRLRPHTPRPRKRGDGPKSHPQRNRLRKRGLSTRLNTSQTKERKWATGTRRGERIRETQKGEYTCPVHVVPSQPGFKTETGGQGSGSKGCSTGTDRS